MTESSRYINTFMNYLGKNKMGPNFARLVTRSLDRKRFKSNRSQNCQRQLSDRKKILEKKRKTEQESQSDRNAESFRIKEGSLGYSIRIVESPRKLEQESVNFSLRLNDMSPRRILSRANSRSSSKEKHFPRFNSLKANKKQQSLNDFLESRKMMAKVNQIGSILSRLTGNPNVSNLRIYKELLKKFYANRYVKEKITSFFDYQYIEDYDSQLRYLQCLLEFKLEEIYFLCFLVLDQNGDGLLCSNDLFIMSTASTQENPLINKDIYKIFQYVSYYRNMRPSVPIMDLPCDEESFKIENTNLQKYRFLKSKKEKEIEKSRKLMLESEKMGNGKKTILIQPESAKHGKKFILTRKTNKHLFSVKHEEQDGQSAIKQLRKRFAKTPLESQTKLVFKVNFNTFKTIFGNRIPQTYFDLIYVIGGIKLQGKEYLPLNFDIQEVEVKERTNVMIDKASFMHETVTEMKNTYRRNKIQKFLTQAEAVKSRYN